MEVRCIALDIREPSTAGKEVIHSNELRFAKLTQLAALRFGSGLLAMHS